MKEIKKITTNNPVLYPSQASHSLCCIIMRMR